MSLLRITLKALLLFIILNILFALTNPLPFIGRLSLYNRLIPGRERLPYGVAPDSYNLSLNSLEAMFASHTISQPKAADEYRIIVLGDSSVWGILLKPDETLTGYLNAAGLRIEGKTARFYNLGYPMMSVTKDVLLLDEAMQYQPDLIIWLVTLQSLPRSEQLKPPLLQHNAERVRQLISRHTLQLDPQDAQFIEPTFIERTIIGQRRALADWWRLQLYGFNWLATGIDQLYGAYTPRSNDLAADTTWYSFDEPQPFTAADLALDMLAAGQTLAGEIPLLLVNEPIFRANGANSDTRYNAWYPQWAYDRYRALLTDFAAMNDWNFLDLWDSISLEEFTDSPVHLTPAGSKQLSETLWQLYANLKTSSAD